MKKVQLLTLLLFAIQFSNAQRFTISGTISDSQSGEQLASATVVDSISRKGTTANYYGFYSLTLPKGNVAIIYSYTGYNPVKMQFNLHTDTAINLPITTLTQLQEVVVTGNTTNKVKSTQMGLIELPIMQSKTLPVLLGEADLMKTIQLMPGVKGGTEGTSGIYVRGGGPDQNLILLDGVPVYNANHAFGAFSVFNSDAIQSFSLLKGGFPARYGGRLSSVIDIKMKEGNNKEFHGEGSIGLISSKLTIEGPIIKDRTSFIISARRTYFDVLTLPFILAATNGKSYGGYYFYDLNAKINHKISDKSRVFLSFYSGLDKVYVVNKSDDVDETGKKTGFNENKSNTGWGNKTFALRWNYIINDKLFMNLTSTYSNYTFFIESGNKMEDNLKNEKQEYKFAYNSGIEDYGLKFDFDYIPTDRHYIRFGTNAVSHRFNPGVSVFNVSGSSENQNQNIDTTFGNKNIFATELSGYVEDEINVSSKFKINLGVHTSLFNVRSKTYNSIQPRASSRYLLTNNIALKVSYIQMMQFIHLLTNNTIGLPTDLWVPSTPTIKPQKAWQAAVGTDINLMPGYSLSVEGYYKRMDNLIEYKEGASFFSQNDDWDKKVEQGKGWSYGTEILLSKTEGKITGWVGYTLSWTERQFTNISFGNPFPFKYDRRHDLAIALTYKRSETFDMGAAWVFGTGTAVTLPTEKYRALSYNPYNTSPYNFNSTPNFSTVQYFKNRNNYRMPSYQRLDLSFNFHKQKRWYKRTWSFGAYNAYNRANPFYLNIETDSETNIPKLYSYSIFPIIPYVLFSFKF